MKHSDHRPKRPSRLGYALTAGLVGLIALIIYSSVADATTIPIRKSYQLQSNWCWAAVAQVVTEQQTRVRVRQCVMASELVADSSDRNYCCTGTQGENPSDERDPDCDKPFYLDEALQHHGVLHNWFTGTVDESDTRSEVNHGYPLALRIGWDNGGGHFILIHGFDDLAQGAYYDVWDPWDGAQYRSRASTVRYKSRGDWSHSYKVGRNR